MVTPSYWPVGPSTAGILGHDEHFGLVFQRRLDAAVTRGAGDTDRTIRADGRCRLTAAAKIGDMSEPYGPPESPAPIHEPPPAAPPEDEAPVARPGSAPRYGAYSEARAAADPQEVHPLPGPATPPPSRSADRGRARPAAVPRWFGRLPYGFVLCGVGAGLAVVATNHFRRGSMLIAASVFIGALARLLLPESQVGMLAVRRRWLDVFLMTAAAVGITLVAFVAKGTSG
jgi:Protein of unknown function (DUF3017)